MSKFFIFKEYIYVYIYSFSILLLVKKYLILEKLDRKKYGNLLYFLILLIYNFI